MNLRWAPSPEEVAAADHAPWDGPLSRYARETPYAALARAGVASVVQYALGAITAFLLVGFAADELRWPLGVVIAGLAALLAALGTIAAIVFLPPTMMRRYMPALAFTTVPGGGVLTSLALLSGGDRLSFIAIIYIEAPIFAVYLFKRWPAVVITCLAIGEYLACVLWLAGPVPPFVEWFGVASTVAGTAFLVGGIARRTEDAAAAERRAKQDLADMNATLNDRVSAQVAELDRLNDLRRFLSPQIAEVVEGQAEDLLQPHRRRIAVMFGDLRGFTAFTNASEPEEVLEVLNAYYAEIGTAIEEHQATIGGYDGDGFMAYFGDPIPVDDPASRAVHLAVELRQRVASLEANWRARGFDLGYGSGVAYGYATLGVVGTSGRLDYTPLGSVVNLASRLCSNAKSGQILIDQATQAATGSSTPSTPNAALDLKGFGAGLATFTVD